MGSAATMTELGLSLQPAMAGFLGGISAMAGGGDCKMLRMEDYVRCLEEERRKIEAFKRELPLCMLILTDVISAMKQEVLQRNRRGGSAGPVLEQFMPTKNGEEESFVEKNRDKENRGENKMNWMSSVQLWSDNSSDCNTESNSNDSHPKNAIVDQRVADGDRESESGNIFTGSGGAILPFQRFVGEKAPSAAIHGDLSLLTNAPNNAQHQPAKGKVLVSSLSTAQSNNVGGVAQQQGPRKVRRCWSPELHRRFVGALQQLGGPQAATPKQIRDLMRVDGLTNDEVKSHLQKYRLHTRRPAPSNAAANHSPTTVVDGRLWVSSGDHYGSSKPSNSGSGSPQFSASTAAAAAAAAAHGLSLTAVDSCDEEDRKSESFSWKGESQRLEEEIE